MKRYFKELWHAEFLNLKSPVNVHSSFVTSCRNTCISAINLEISPLRSFKIKVVLLQCISLVLMIGSTHVINMYYVCKLSTIIFLKPEIMLSVYALNCLILCITVHTSSVSVNYVIHLYTFLPLLPFRFNFL